MMQRALSILLFSILSVGLAPGDDYEPEVLGNNVFAALLSQSPFNRTLNLSGSLILTGIARIDEQQVATLLNTTTKETYLVSATPNEQGWKMVEITPNEDLAMVTAKISLAGEVVSIRYAETKLKPGETRPGGGTPRKEAEKPSSSRHSEKKGPPDDIRKKVETLNDEQKGKFFSKIKELREKHPEMSDEERTEYARKTLEKISKKEKKS